MSIIVRIHGGLGNQLFQYAFARGISSHLKTDFLIDASPFLSPRYNPHLYNNKCCFEHFNTKIRFAKGYTMFGFVWLRRHRKVFDFFYNHLRLKKRLLPFYYPERIFTFDPGVFKKGTTYFDGFWQIEKYFKDIGDEIRNELTVITPFSEYGKNMSEEIQKVTAVSLHVRRGDYITNIKANASIGVCSLEYYMDAVREMEKHISSPHFFIFSDDYEWALENFKNLRHPVTCIKGSEEKNYEDLTLMSQCKHHIIANSSFSWWGAWLNPKKDKVVIAPKKWFRNQPKASISDLIPEEWIKL